MEIDREQIPVEAIKTSPQLFYSHAMPRHQSNSQTVKQKVFRPLAIPLIHCLILKLHCHILNTIIWFILERESSL